MNGLLRHFSRRALGTRPAVEGSPRVRGEQVVNRAARTLAPRTVGPAFCLLAAPDRARIGALGSQFSQAARISAPRIPPARSSPSSSSSTAQSTTRPPARLASRSFALYRRARAVRNRTSTIRRPALAVRRATNSGSMPNPRRAGPAPADRAPHRGRLRAGFPSRSLSGAVNGWKAPIRKRCRRTVQIAHRSPRPAAGRISRSEKRRPARPSISVCAAAGA